MRCTHSSHEDALLRRGQVHAVPGRSLRYSISRLWSPYSDHTHWQRHSQTLTWPLGRGIVAMMAFNIDWRLGDGLLGGNKSVSSIIVDPPYQVTGPKTQPYADTFDPMVGMDYVRRVLMGINNPGGRVAIFGGKGQISKQSWLVLSSPTRHQIHRQRFEPDAPASVRNDRGYTTRGWRRCVGCTGVSTMVDRALFCHGCRESSGVVKQDRMKVAEANVFATFSEPLPLP